MFSAFHTRCTMRLHKCTIAVLGKNFIEMSNKTVTAEKGKNDGTNGEKRPEKRNAGRKSESMMILKEWPLSILYTKQRQKQLRA